MGWWNAGRGGGGARGACLSDDGAPLPAAPPLRPRSISGDGGTHALLPAPSPSAGGLARLARALGSGAWRRTPSDDGGGANAPPTTDEMALDTPATAVRRLSLAATPAPLLRASAPASAPPAATVARPAAPVKSDRPPPSADRDARLSAALGTRTHAALAAAWAAAASGDLTLDIDALNALLAASCRVGGVMAAGARRGGRGGRAAGLPVHPADAERVVAAAARAGALAPTPATLRGLAGLWTAHEQQQQ